MRLAEALILRGDIQKRLAQLQDRFKRSSWVQEGEKPAEDPRSCAARWMPTSSSFRR